MLSFKERTEILGKIDKFAADAHEAVGQFRKYSDLPYIVHPREVMEILEAHGVEDIHMLCAALLHDVVEDTDITRNALHDFLASFQEPEFAPQVVERLVDDLTDPTTLADGNRKRRFAINLGHTAEISEDAKTIKLADIISNTKDIAEHDKKFAAVYIPEIIEKLKVLKNASSFDLYMEACHTVWVARRELEQHRWVEKYKFDVLGIE